MIRVGMVSLGCPKNQVDAEVLLGTLNKDEFQIVNDENNADVIIINTCGFIESAKEESIEFILEYCGLKEETDIKSVIVTGCLAQRYGEDIKRDIPEVDAIVGIGENEHIEDIIKASLKSEGVIYRPGNLYDMPLAGNRVVSTPSYTAYVKIAEGCDNFCTYCAIPMIRGKFRSREMEDIIEEVKGLAENGVKEIVLVAQDTSYYGNDIYGEPKIAPLLKKLTEIDGLRWIRMLYCYPERITDELLDVMASEEKIVKYLDIPLQHANGTVLKRMNRHGDYNMLKELIEKVRAKVPGITIRTTMIAGFPGETEEQFEDLCKFIKEMEFERLGCFAFSPEENTPAAKLDGQIDDDVRTKRASIVQQTQYFISLDETERKIGTTQLTLVEGYDEENNIYYGRTTADAPDIDCKIFFESDSELKPGDFVNVKVLEAADQDLIGTII